MIKKVVLTGGPGSGKTTVIESIKSHFSSKYKVIVVDETASYLINMGITFGDNEVPLLDFQELVLKMQLAKEELVDRTIEMLPDKDILVIYDRGLLDNCAYISKEQFQEILGRLNKKYTANEFLERYDLIINLVSRKDFYTTENNPARSENVDQALELGNKTLYSWIGHKNIKIAFPKDSMDDKINEVLGYISKVLEEKEVKKQSKYLIDIKSTNMDLIKSTSKKADITQDYLESDSTVEKRLRKTTMGGVTTYNYTIYKTLEDGRKVKVSDESLSEKMYKKLLDFKDKMKETIKKERYYFSYNDEYFSLDVIDEYGILEINTDEGRKVIIPPFINVLEDVSNNPAYLNTNIASSAKKKPQVKVLNY